MKNKKQKKSGFTLVELMVVAIIVAILAAVAIPLMTGNTKTAMATEAQTGCATVAHGIKLWLAEGGTGGDTNSTPTIAELPGISDSDLQGNFYESYTVGSVDGSTSYEITAIARTDDDAKAEDVTMTVVNGQVSWTGMDLEN